MVAASFPVTLGMLTAVRGVGHGFGSNVVTETLDMDDERYG
jgi:hypothetical protein